MENPFEIILEKLNRIEMILAGNQLKRIEEAKATHVSEYLNVLEAAEFLRVSAGSIYRYVMNGVLPKRKFGNRLYFRKEVLQQILESNIKNDKK